jgi:hypothetical protein
MRVIAFLISTLFFMISCSFITVNPNGNPNTAQDVVIDYVTFVGSSHDFNKTENITPLTKDGIVRYINRLNLSKKNTSAYKFWYLVTGVTQLTGGWYYEVYEQQGRIMLCLKSPDNNSSVTMALQAPLLLIGVNGDVRLEFNDACTGRITKNSTKKKIKFQE